MPQLGETVTEGTVLRWCKQVGERIAVDEALLEVSTDKVDAEVPSPVAGEIVEILVAEGDTVPIGARLAVITESDGEVAAPAPVTPPAPTASPAPAPTAAPEPVAAPPAPAPPPPSAPAAPAAIEPGVVPFSNIRKRTAENLTQSLRTSAHTLVAVEVDYEGVNKVRRAAGLTYLPFVMRAVVDALAEFPRLNASVVGDDLVVHGAVHLGIAVDLDFQGLVVPVIRDAQGKTLAELAAAAADLAQRAHAKRLTADDLAGGTFTITNAGGFGTLLTGPIINQPQVGIVSTDGVTMRPVAIRDRRRRVRRRRASDGQHHDVVRPSSERWCVLLGVPREGQADRPTRDWSTEVAGIVPQPARRQRRQHGRHRQHDRTDDARRVPRATRSSRTSAARASPGDRRPRDQPPDVRAACSSRSPAPATRRCCSASPGTFARATTGSSPTTAIRP